MLLSSQVTWELTDGMASVVLADNLGVWVDNGALGVWVDNIVSGQMQTAIKRICKR